MSPTLLEFVVVIILLIVAWQLGLLIAPFILREINAQIQAFDEAGKQGPPEAHQEPSPSEEASTNGTHR
jgi:hypothetical protein